MKISFCITALNWLQYLAKTLPVNFASVGLYDTEYVLLDLGSSDGTQEYIQRHFQSLIDIGSLVYFRAEGIRYYQPSMAKNASSKLSTGDIICNLDGDNFSDRNFALYLLGLFQSDHGLKAVLYPGLTDRTGRIAVRRETFFNLNGYDEQMHGYGSEDIDFRERITRSGAKMIFGDPSKYSAVLNPDKTKANYASNEVHQTDQSNRALAMANGRAGRIQANQWRPWGKIIVKRNFTEFVETE